MLAEFLAAFSVMRALVPPAGLASSGGFRYRITCAPVSQPVLSLRKGKVGPLRLSPPTNALAAVPAPAVCALEVGHLVATLATRVNLCFSQNTLEGSPYIRPDEGGAFNHPIPDATLHTAKLQFLNFSILLNKQ